jgi:1,6-anhydro-N-acetylmuramate kinase
VGGTAATKTTRKPQTTLGQAAKSHRHIQERHHAAAHSLMSQRRLPPFHTPLTHVRTVLPEPTE